MKNKIFKIKINGKILIIKDYTICDNFFLRARGLMFRSKDYRKPLVFTFKKPGRYPIHSFFCRKFVAVWMLKGRIIDEKIIESWKFHVVPAGKFDTLIEIPFDK